MNQQARENNQQLILVINCGSSSLKFALFNLLNNHTDDKGLIIEGLAESLNHDIAKISFKTKTNKHVLSKPLLGDKNAALGAHFIVIEEILNYLEQHYKISQTLYGIGHRVVHGGSVFKQSVIIDAHVIEQIKQCIPLAPLHNPANLMGIEAVQSHFPSISQVAVFDTAFHQSMPPMAYIYALPYALYQEEGVRRYGFHGTSHCYITQQAALFFDKPVSDINLVTAHLGNGASVAAIKYGKSVDTSMGMTPLEGLVMGTRSGDIDPGIFDFLLSKGYQPEQISELLNKQSGLLGISGISNDMRTLCDHAEQGNERALLALDIFCFRLAKYIAAMIVSLKSLDALVFTGGIGENSSIVREKTIHLLSMLGFKIHTELNKHNTESSPTGYKVNTEDSHTILVIPTDEESMIVQDTISLISQN